ncbi:MAG: double-strand break repair protein AddB [Pseudomonadota bacterium]
MFEPSDTPRIFGLPPGADFPKALVEGLAARLEGAGPADWARVQIFVNTRRMQRRLRSLFDAGPARLLPRIDVVSDIGRNTPVAGLPPSVSPLRRRLELAQLVSELIAVQPDLAPGSAAFDLADSLATLMDEMQGEGVSFDTLRTLDVSRHSAHWARSLRFIGIVEAYLAASGTDAPDPEARQRLVIEALIARWQEAPPDHPVIMAGTTGSRGTTALLMDAVAQLPHGAVVLPGYDFDMPDAIWERLKADPTQEDHPQYRFAALLDRLDLLATRVPPWTAHAAPAPARNALVSLSLRPAPVTNQWLSEGAKLRDLDLAMAGVALLEAPSDRHEATAIALMMRDALEADRTVALITPDRMLGRRVTAMLDRWGIEPDDSAGRPLALSAPGRFLRHVAALAPQKITSEALLVLLKHPLTATGGDRGQHLIFTRNLELWIRKAGAPFPTRATLDAFRKTSDDPRITTWCAWVADALLEAEDPRPHALQTHVEALLSRAEQIAAGPEGGNSALWLEAAGRTARAAMDDLAREAGAGGTMHATEFEDLLRTLLNRQDVRDPVRPHPGVMIWGTLEARVQGADLVILGGLNDGIWPSLAAPDPWLNRAMRREAGLLLPERQVGLSAHDYQQAIAAPDVVISRAVRSGDVEPVPSRWLNRLTNLLDGLPDQGGKRALKAMRARGQVWVDRARALDLEAPQPPAPRPSPRPPVAARPTKLSVTAIQRLIRDPYAIYARHILGLPVIGPLRPQADALVRGNVLHAVFDAFVGDTFDPDGAAERLSETAERVLADRVPWPVARRLWQARITEITDWFLDLETRRRRSVSFVASECRGEVTFDEIGFTLHCIADRIDRLGDGRLVILDYKTGPPPTPRVMQAFDKQLLLEAVIAEAGGFDGIPAAPVDHVAYIGLGSDPTFAPYPLIDTPERTFATASVRAGLIRLIRRYQSRSSGYTARRAMQKVRFEGDYDHLARFGEWDDSAETTPEDVG